MTPADPFAPTLTLSGGTRLTKALAKDQPFVIGSERSATFRIPHPSIGPRHVVLLWDGAATRLDSVGDARSLLINGRAPATNAPLLKHGDDLRIGDFEFVYHQPSPASSSSNDDAPQTILYKGKAVSEVRLRGGLTLGRGDGADMIVDDPALLPIHASFEATPQGFVAVDKGGSGLLANGHFFERHLLYIGDRLDVGEHATFVYDGYALQRVARSSGCGLSAEDIEVRVGAQTILRDAGFAARSGEFVGIIGPSGAGKTTLLRVLAGLVIPQAGAIMLNRTPTRELNSVHGYFGFVPQQEIIHLDLTGRQALRYAAALRLPARTPALETEKLITLLAGRLGLEERLDIPARQLSGGQLKRLSVAVEMLSRPPILLLDEPTSGLDPESESQLMRQLRELTAAGCTVVCTTHLMENVHLMDSVEIVSASPQRGEPGTTVFRGKPSMAREIFEVQDMADIYGKLRERSPSDWKALFEKRTDQRAGVPPLTCTQVAPTPPPVLRRRAALPILLRRQWDIVRSDWKNLALLAGQPLLIGALIALAANGPKDHSATKLFLACTAAFWMACGNAAPELVRERAIFQRERYAGLGVGSYFTAKFLWLWLVALVQMALLYAMLLGGLHGSVFWQSAALAGASLAATGVGLFISAWSRSVLQAVLLVPIVTIPQILFSGYVFKLQDWNTQPAARVASRFFPGFAAQRLVDTSMLWQQRILNYADLDEAGLITSYENLCTALYPWSVWIHAEAPATFTVDETRLYSAGPRNMALQPQRELTWEVKNPPSFRLGATYAWSAPGWNALLALVLWAVLSSAGALYLTRRRANV